MAVTLVDIFDQMKKDIDSVISGARSKVEDVAVDVGSKAIIISSGLAAMRTDGLTDEQTRQLYVCCGLYVAATLTASKVVKEASTAYLDRYLARITDHPCYNALVDVSAAAKKNVS